MARSKGSGAQFTYDFGIAIAQSTVNKVAKLAGVTLTLASAFYALKSAGASYVNTLRENTLRFGGVLSTMKAMEQAQDRLIKGQSYFSVDDQLKGMNKLMEAGVNVGKNLDWINKAAHATGKSYAEFSGMIASAVQGNTNALVEAGLMTQRATRMFDKYQGNTVMRQQAILNFLKSHKGLQNAIKNDFETIGDQINRLKGIWRGFLTEIVGKPNDPSSLYGQTRAALKEVAEGLSRHWQYIKRAAWQIGQVTGWVIKQIGHFVTWLGRKLGHAIQSVWKITDAYQEQTRSLIVWLEFWKLKILDFLRDLWTKTSNFFHEYGGEIKTIIKLALIYAGLRQAFIIGRAAYLSVLAIGRAWKWNIALARRYGASVVGPAFGKGVLRFHQAMAFLPRSIRRPLIAISKMIGRYIISPIQNAGGVAKWFGGIFRTLIGWIAAPFKFLGRVIGMIPKGLRFVINLIKNLPTIFMSLVRAGKALYAVLLGSNPVGWIILVITLLVTLYAKCRTFRVYINNAFKWMWEVLKLIYNLIVGAITYAIVGIKKAWLWFKAYIWTPIANFFKSAWGWIKDMWKAFMNTAVGRFINKWIVQPLRSLFDWMIKAWNWIIKAVAKAVEWISGANSDLAKSINKLAAENGLPTMAVEGGNYDTNDDTNYLNPNNWGVKEPSAPGNLSNPLSTGGGSDMGAISSVGGGGGGGNTTSMVFNNGAIQIVVQKGEGVDEATLARRVRDVLNDMKRDGDMRGGTA